jgi:hypothetical protein
LQLSFPERESPGITGVLFVSANPRARRWFRDRAERRMWGAFHKLPAGSTILRFVPITVVSD